VLCHSLSSIQFSITLDHASCHDGQHIEGISSHKSPAGKVWNHSPTEVPRPLFYESKEEVS